MAANTPDFDTLIIGAGVVGLATAFAATRTGGDVLILDRNRHFGQETSSRSSEVIHAGVYYPPHSLKARLCVAGNARLYSFVGEYGVPFLRCGKLIVATSPEQLPQLDQMARNAEACGVARLERLDQREAEDREPALMASGALFSSSTGILDSHAYMTALLGAAEARGAQFVGNSAVARIEREGALWRVFVVHDPEASFTARHVVNSAGLWAGEVADAIVPLSPKYRPTIRYARGRYFSYAGEVPFTHLIYPLPVPGGLGTHLTLDLAGRGRFGPDVEWIDRLDYTVDEVSRGTFAHNIALYWPELQADRLMPAYAGIRPKLVGAGKPAADFLVSGPTDHGLPGLVNLFGIESPGITASLPLGELAISLARNSGDGPPGT